MRLSKTIMLFLLMLFYSTSYIQSTNLDLVNERIHLIEYLMDNNLAYSQEVRLHDIAQWEDELVQSPNQKIPDRKTKCVIKTHINIKQNVIFGAKLKPV